MALLDGSVQVIGRRTMNGLTPDEPPPPPPTPVAPPQIHIGPAPIPFDNPPLVQPQQSPVEMFQTLAHRIAPVTAHVVPLATHLLPGIASGQINVLGPHNVAPPNPAGYGPNDFRPLEFVPPAPGENLPSARLQPQTTVGPSSLRDLPLALTKAAAFPAKILAAGIGEVPAPQLRAFLPPALGGQAPEFKKVKHQDPVTQFVYQSLPYFLAPEAGTAVFAASLPDAVHENVQAYQSGQIDGGELVKNLVVTLGPLIAPELAKLGIKGAAAAAQFARSPEGKALLQKLNEQRGGSAGEPPVPGAGDVSRPAGADLPPPAQSADVTASSGIESIAKKMRDMITTARKLAPAQAAMISEQKGQRVQNAAARLEQGGGLPAFHESKSFLAGEYDKPTFEPPNMPPEDINAMVDHIATNFPDAQYFDKVEALSAIEKWTMGVKPQPRELDKLESFIPGLDLKSAYDAQAMSGGVRGVENPVSYEGLSDRGQQLHLLESDPEYVAARTARDQSTTAEMRAKYQAEMDRIAAQRQSDSANAQAIRDANLPNNGSQMHLLESDPEYVAARQARDAATDGNLKARYQAEMDRIAAQREKDAAAFADRRANPFPSDESAIPERGLPPEQFGVGGERATGPETGQQLHLADQINQAYVGALSDGSLPDAKARITKILEGALSATQLIKTIKTSFDIGWGGRNGWRLMPRNPAEWIRMYGRQYKAFASEAAFEEMQAAAKAYPWRQRADASERPLALLEKGTGSPETSGEEYTSPYTKYVPGLNGSERAYVAPGNLMRGEWMDKNLKRLVDANKKPVSDADFQLLEDIGNNATLRGNTAWLKKVPHASELASLLFSAKGLVSGPQFALDMLRAVVNGGGKYSPEARKIAAEQFGAYVAMGMSTLGLVAATGWGLSKAGKPGFVSVDLNHLSPTFGQVNIGGFRYNYWGSDQSLVRTAIQLAAGQTQQPGLDAADASRRRLATNFLGNKVSPGLPKFLFDEAVNSGRTYNSGVFNDTGMKINTPMGALIYAFNQVAPISLESTVQSFKDNPYIAPATFLAETHGLSSSTYDNGATPVETLQQKIKDSAFKSLMDRRATADKARADYIKKYGGTHAQDQAAGDYYDKQAAVKTYHSKINADESAFWHDPKNRALLKEIYDFNQSRKSGTPGVNIQISDTEVKKILGIR